MIRVLKSIALIVILTSILQLVLAYSQKIDRQTLGVTDFQEEPDCSQLEPPNLWGPYNGKLNINRELVANDFAFYAAIAHDAT